MDINELINDMDFINGIAMDDIPEIDLYMDQVIQLFEGKLSSLKRTEDDKILTKTMINNYAKGKLLLPIKNKKYTKEHIILMSLIYNLKGALSINDIKLSLNKIIDSFSEDESYPLRELYGSFLDESENDVLEFKKGVADKEREIEALIESKSDLQGDFEKKFLLLCSFVNMSNMYRRASEKLIDEFFSEVKGE
ncbi:DUF1836 domain-containing protein [Clostridium sp. NSJ-49]|jgi:hypothetical protein|uniref:Protein of uncharacterized function (DUF1836) n=1 Tax=Clostridium disporicum TaxID=84024 RepID=A0A174ELK9_9CLOT|nr:MULTISPECIES: DUF1836 domain-containing protein [Clostridium]MBC5624126.1 DUF1836 domain-containing protein [Clostridium sp. NSJ-49]MCD2503020.1 DUF1836 domain-containing protein [Clostridium sp. NSJ-145]CUO38922.1 protein of uncharacterised function (DUF1836) [Clostridium disporicum]